jgi:hypothetical protein
MLRQLIGSLAARVGGAFALAALMGMSSPAAAGDAALAERLFQEGKALMERGETDEACEKFQASMAAEPSGGAALNYGRCSLLQGKTATAWAEYKRAASLFRAQRDEEREAFALEQAAELEPTLSTMTIEAGATEGMEIRRDGVLLTTGALGEPTPVDPGDHVVEASSPGFATWSQTVAVGPGGASVTVQIPVLTKLPDPPPAKANEDDTLLWAGGIVAGAGAALVVAGSVVGVTVLSDVGDAEDDPALCGNPAKQCTQAGYDQVQAAGDRAVVADVLLAVGGAGVVGGGVLVLVALLGEPAAADGAAWSVSPHPGGAAIRVSF